ncbi:MBL fold metallo-hydrolase [Hyphomicrobium sp. CS1GBMeth3]|uniref:MBL fold metallo-hydrolase n=1 Tax=Hyphomicrobium sp. CS1GBMeth3 TaxID=1892845 RepID=UPI00092FDFAA|nr:MBL fold metallo-hydrolase [Hyphomicrobium sp. CS1GBMeth3]
MTGHLRVLRPHPAIYAFYDGRVPGYRFAEQKNWIDEGALALGIASYAIVSGHKALVCDTHVSVAHATAIREILTREAGVTDFTVLLSHWHLDHVAGTVAFDDSPIIATDRTAEHLKRRQSAIEAGTLEGPPAISPLILPTRGFTGSLTFELGDIRLELIEANIHSDDAAVIWWADERILLAGDTMEDTVTYVMEPDSLPLHLVDLERLDKLAPARILPNHGAPDIIEQGGYNRGFNRATQQYIRSLIRCKTDAELREAPLKELIRGPLANGWVTYFEPYEGVHRENVDTVCSVGANSMVGRN